MYVARVLSCGDVGEVIEEVGVEVEVEVEVVEEGLAEGTEVSLPSLVGERGLRAVQV